MTQTSEQTGGHQGLTLNGGRLTARPGDDLYLYTFTTSGGRLPGIGRRGCFISGPNSFPAKVTDRRGPQISISLVADKPLKASLSGRFVAAPLAQPPAPKAEDLAAAGQPGPAGAAGFLDGGDGWLMSATEAAGWKQSFFDSGHWPTIGRSELAAEISESAGINFIWRQKPDEQAATARAAADYLAGLGSLLILGDAPADLEPLADLTPSLSGEELPGRDAVFAGPAQPGTPLHPISIYTKAAEAAQAHELEIARLRNSLNDLKSEEGSLKAGLGRWEDLAALEADFSALAQKTAQYAQSWDRARDEAESARLAWAEARTAVESGRKSLLGLFKSGPNAKALAREESSRQTLEAAESAMAVVRREEEQTLQQARQLEKRLTETRLESENWRPKNELEAGLAALKTSLDQTGGLLAAALNRARPVPADFLKGRLVLALAEPQWDKARPPAEGEAGLHPPAFKDEPGEALAARRFQSVLLLCSRCPDHRRKKYIAGLVLAAEKHLAVIGDFTLWPVWSGQAPPTPGNPGRKSWNSFIVAEDADEVKTFLAKGFLCDQSLPALPPGSPRPARLEQRPEHPPALADAPKEPKEAVMEAAAPDITRLPGRLVSPPAAAPAGPLQAPDVQGLGLRARGEMGPANPVSALCAARAAAAFAADYEGPGPAAIIVTASQAQAALARLMLADLGLPAGRVFTGEPTDFDHWPKVPLVIADPAFEAPHATHPWAWPSYGQGRLMRAWLLARDKFWLLGRGRWLERLPSRAPLAIMWRRAEGGEEAEGPADAANLRQSIARLTANQAPLFWEALDKAKEDIWLIAPALEAFWWRPLEEHFWAAARRGVKVTLLVSPPGRDMDSQYAAKAIRTMFAYGGRVHLAQGLPGFMALIDKAHLTWGNLRNSPQPARIWSGLASAVLPLAGPEISRILQIDLINEKMDRGGGLKICRDCGWPLVLVNQDKVRGLNDDQPLKTACLKGCGGAAALRRLDGEEARSRVITGGAEESGK
ncbi:hypothetical protein LJB99_03735 [Deltaproteobacteria bacterium OttesenSCG-928-K17]|nr:hypothetical protein [Deltaproteobacteria bacterium OttesenSCG-928-K17]